MRKLPLLIAALAVTVTTALAYPGTAKADIFNEWHPPFANGQCMGVAGGNMTPGTPIIDWQCDNSLNQLWGLDLNSGTQNAYLLRNERNHSECLSVDQKSTNVGAHLVIWPCKSVSDNQDQRWIIADAPTAAIINFNSGLQILPGGDRAGAEILQGTNQVPFLWVRDDFVIG
jgi:hypothetical protein